MTNNTKSRQIILTVRGFVTKVEEGTRLKMATDDTDVRTLTLSFDSEDIVYITSSQKTVSDISKSLEIKNSQYIPIKIYEKSQNLFNILVTISTLSINSVQLKWSDTEEDIFSINTIEKYPYGVIRFSFKLKDSSMRIKMSNYKSLSSLELHSSDKELKENKINEDINNLQDKIEKINEFESQMKETMIKLTNLGKKFDEYANHYASGKNKFIPAVYEYEQHMAYKKLMNDLASNDLSDDISKEKTESE